MLNRDLGAYAAKVHHDRSSNFSGRAAMATNRTIQELLDQMEIPENGRSTSPTSQFGSTSRKKGTNPHGGLDMNRGHAVGGSVSSPVYGIIGSEIGGKLGKIVIHEV